MIPAERRAKVRLEVPFHDVDSLGIVWHGHYLKYIEIGRTKLFGELGLRGGSFRELGCQLVVIESRLRHSAPLRFGDEFEVTSWLKEIDLRIVVAYEIRNVASDARVLRAETTMVCLDLSGNLTPGTPPGLLQFLGRTTASDGHP